MADTFQNLDLEKINADVKKQVDEILAGIDLTEINTNVEKILQDIETKKDKLLPEDYFEYHLKREIEDQKD